MASTGLIDPKTVYSELEKYKPELEAALPRHMTPDRLARIALTELRKTPKLFACTKESFMGSILMAAQLGLEPGVLGQCYLIPYKDTCTFVPGWRGLMDLLGRTARASAWTGAVHDGDEFEFDYGDRPRIHHRPGKWAGDKDALIYTYAVGRQNGMEWPVVDVWDIDKIWSHRARFNKVGDKHYSYNHQEMYARKIPLLQVLKYLPSSVELTMAQGLEISGSDGKQRLTLEGVIKPADSALQEAEVEQLMEKMGWDDPKREAFRDNYAGRTLEALDYLKGEAGKASKVTSATKATTKNVSEVSGPKTEPAQVAQSAQQAVAAQSNGKAQPESKTDDFWS